MRDRERVCHLAWTTVIFWFFGCDYTMWSNCQMVWTSFLQANVRKRHKMTRLLSLEPSEGGTTENREFHNLALSHYFQTPFWIFKK